MSSARSIFETCSNSQRINPRGTHTAAFSVSEPLYSCSYFVQSTEVSKGKEVGKWKVYLHAIRLLKNKILTILYWFSKSKCKWGQRSRPWKTALLKKTIIRFHLQQCLLLSRPLAKKLKARQAGDGHGDGQHANSTVLKTLFTRLWESQSLGHSQDTRNLTDSTLRWERLMHKATYHAFNAVPELRG